MTPERLTACLRTIRWSTNALAEAVDVPGDFVNGWLAGRMPIPRAVAAWLEALSFVHESAEITRPPTSGEGFAPRQRPEHVPVYAYSLLRELSGAPVPLRRLFGTDDEGAVFFLVSRDLATRSGSDLVITELGRAVGEV